MAIPVRLFNQCQLSKKMPSSWHWDLASKQSHLPGMETWVTSTPVALRSGRMWQDHSKYDDSGSSSANRHPHHACLLLRL
ncbi:hypothetical protein FOPG_14932 [Fusarium oxysporum f. sp. conglutinans race 2 54008]|uniref:Uncharacterized protein n=1 Tax=Fusarium oxysporum f. sp. conglutinans race 2 54008 TaxID=1089457 RepID=X0H022_FUSOX|nr:hypothetical protein FOPG_14932 [Fusarium oxysporum f. sp. conglutinans race 2 54008]